jgi:PKD domain
MRRLVAFMLAVVSGVGGTILLSPMAQAASTGNSARQTGRIVSEEPSKLTPDISDGTVYSITQVGNQIIVGGSFTAVQNPNSTTDLPRSHVFAFDASTGIVNPNFNPAPNGTVYKVQAAADGTSVYIGGQFTAAFGGAAAKNLVLADATTGARRTGFAPPNLDGQVRDLEVVGTRLWVAGKFTHIGGRAQKALGTLNATSGAYDAYFAGQFSGLHNPALAGSVTDVLQISANAANTQLMAVGNFTTVDTQSRSQIVKLDLGATTATVSPWSTNLFTSACSAKFDTYVTDVEYSPDGSYFVVSTTGAYGGQTSNNGGNGCDVVARFESNTSTLSSASWTAYTGGDTTWDVEVTDNVIYAGGHQRWQNNPGAGDTAGPGAVERTGIAALNPVNGMAYSWNPTRARGVGVQDMLANSQGLYVGSDTTLIGKTAGNTFHARIALMPLSTGKTLPTIAPHTLPADVYTVPTAGTQLVRRNFTGTTATAPVTAPNGPGWSNAVGAFMVNNSLYIARSTGVLTKQTFDGTTYGTPTTVSTADALVRQAGWHDTDIPALTSLFYANGRIYFTLSGQNSLFYRGFEVEDDIVGQQRFSTPAPTGISYTNMRGAFVAAGKLYYTNLAGQLFSATWGTNAPTGAGTQVTGSGVTGVNFASRAMFVNPGAATAPPTNAAPTAVVGAPDCSAGLSCTFDASGSSDPDGDTLTYTWTFGDTTTGTGVKPTHAYTSAGSFPVTVTVDDGNGHTDRASTTATPAATPPANHAPTATPTASCGGTLTCSFTAGANDVDGDTLTYDWDFGDRSTHGTTATPQHTYAAADAGAKTVTLVVTDGKGGSVTKTVTANPTDATAAGISFVDAASTTGNRSNHTVTIPTTVQAGDALLLLFTTNSINGTFTDPAGWTQLEGKDATGIRVRAYTKVATATDKGSSVGITTGNFMRSEMTVGAYRGTGTTPVASSASNLDTAPGANHVSPVVSAVGNTDWLVTYWADKSGSSTTDAAGVTTTVPGTSAWTTPAGQTVRDKAFGAGTSTISGVLVDSAGPVSGTTGNLTATANTTSSRGASVSVLLQTP